MKKFRIINLILIICFASCNQSEIVYEYGNNSIEHDSVFYKLECIDTDSTSYLIEKGKVTALVLNTFIIDSLTFSGKNGFSKAISYYQSRNGTSEITMQTAIYLLNSNAEFKKIWYRNEPVAELSVNGAKNYAVSTSKISLEDGFINYRGHVYSCIRIINTEPCFDGGYKKNSLNFINKSYDVWSLISRERLNTMAIDPANEKLGYCIDSIYTESWDANIKPIYIGTDMLYRLSSADCDK